MLSHGRMASNDSQWAARYAEQHTPWDLGRAHPQLLDWLAGRAAGGRVLVPGCGTGFDACALAQAGWQVTALDLIPDTVHAAKRAAIEASGGEVLVLDALAFEPPQPYELIFEHTFFCAIDPSQREDWGRLMDRCLGADGELLALVFPVDRGVELGGPPHGYAPADMQAVLGAGFRMLEDIPAEHPVKSRSWKERWVRFARS